MKGFIDKVTSRKLRRDKHRKFKRPLSSESGTQSSTPEQSDTTTRTTHHIYGEDPRH